MLKLFNLINFPAFYKKRNEKLDDVSFTNIIVKNNAVIGKSNNHNCIIEFENNQIDKNSPIKVYCSCESFKYEFSRAVHFNDSLLNSESFGNFLMKKTTTKNIYSIPSGCKHLVKLARFIFQNKMKIQKEINNE